MCFSEYYGNHHLFPDDLHGKFWNYLELFLTFFSPWPLLANYSPSPKECSCLGYLVVMTLFVFISPTLIFLLELGNSFARIHPALLPTSILNLPLVDLPRCDLAQHCCWSHVVIGNLKCLCLQGPIKWGHCKHSCYLPPGNHLCGLPGPASSSPKLSSQANSLSPDSLVWPQGSVWSSPFLLVILTSWEPFPHTPPTNPTTVIGIKTHWAFRLFTLLAGGIPAT